MKRNMLAVGFCGLMLAAALSQVGCATAALHGHMTGRDADVALRAAANGRPMLCADAQTDIFDKTHWDTIMENWPLYLGTTVLDLFVGYYVWKGLQQEEKDAPDPVYNTENNYYPAPVIVEEPAATEQDAGKE